VYIYFGMLIAQPRCMPGRGSMHQPWSGGFLLLDRTIRKALDHDMRKQQDSKHE